VVNRFEDVHLFSSAWSQQQRSWRAQRRGQREMRRQRRGQVEAMRMGRCRDN
jgi:hypothetical protein